MGDYVYRYPKEVHDFVKEWSPKMRDEELAEKCNAELGTHFTAAKMKAFRGNHGYRNYRKKSLSGEEYWKYQKRYPQGMYEYIRDNSWGVSSKDMAERVNELFGTNFTQVQMKCFRQRHGIKSGVTGWYQKGHEPGNKGKKLEEYVTDPVKLEEIKARMRPTQFKKGQQAKNEYPLGPIITNSEGWVLIKTSMTGKQWERWEPLHRVVWRKHHGSIPEGMLVSFKDGNRQNCDISNLMLITQGESAALSRKGFRFEDPDLTDAGLAVVRLQKKIRERRSNK